MAVSKEVIERVRNNFLKVVENSSDKFHHDDVERVKTNDYWVERFVLVTKTEDSALNALIKAMEWRKEFGVNEMTSDDYFPEEIYKIGVYHDQFVDKEGRTVIYNRMGRYHKSDLGPLIRRHLVYLIEKAERKAIPSFGIVSDTINCGLSNVDMDLAHFQIEVLQNYYPRGAAYLVAVDLPWVLNATAKLVMAFMNAELKSLMKFIKKNELTQYMDPKYIPVYMKGSYDKDMVFIPEGAKPMDQLSHLHLSGDQINKIRSTFKSELK